MWKRALKFTAGKPVVLNLYTHNKQAVALYKRWGFFIDKTKKPTWSHWPEWPKGIRAKRIYMRLNPPRRRTVTRS
ncbi:hypothetical protein A3D71_00425 [Candidatus Kaiserbacteria bacterium RIFCSPHIGHO2_02_FULL_55_20]|uniref:N-acetyltransferase domain-containing protein n=1 Tax=Candidatus Kaiserbacteria bacterium RIFCSPHIGHO2_02_FULL_55_20 TaxID=1798497 RepID=A0A1F6DX79_9BACT|nr:MAG: hypothetical protein A2680_04600 [Candidatus Kaiserbacteria bacterium RIFCSPHIGHO2_01_FULL_55_37]OGG66031.1 MAG: hypothetical protein A3D71_00425 [Candidatus Kaiserbacteria bacterium RIFCSPHIGHO2_02_FULL_55_20]